MSSRIRSGNRREDQKKKLELEEGAGAGNRSWI